MFLAKKAAVAATNAASTSRQPDAEVDEAEDMSSDYSSGGIFGKYLFATKIF